MVDVNNSNGVLERLAANFVADAAAMTLEATTTEFVGPGIAPYQIRWQMGGQGWIRLVADETPIPAGDYQHDFFDLPKLLWPHRYAPLTAIWEGIEPIATLSGAGAQLLGNGRAHRVIATVDRGLGVIRSYRAEDVDGKALRTVDLTFSGRQAL